MPRFHQLCAAVLLAAGSSLAMADAASHAADAERFLKLAHADKLTVPVYGQVQQMFAQRFAQAPEGKQAVLESYQAKANAALDKAVGWDKLKPDMVKLYTSNFDEKELQGADPFLRVAAGAEGVAEDADADGAIGTDHPGQAGNRRA